jgi:hypothetical protein
MIRLQVRNLGPGMHPSEQIVEIETKDSKEEVIVDKSLVKEDSIAVGLLSVANGHRLVELPRETMRGLWRVWVSEKKLVNRGG